MSLIHPSAIIDAGASIGEGTSIGPYSVIGQGVRLGRNNRIGPHVVLEGHTTIGDGNTIFQFASVGAVPQDLKYKGEPSTLEIGNDNIIREYVTLQPGTEGGGMRTCIGNKNLFMACAHVGHDAQVGSYNVFANSAALAGHVIVGSYCTIGGLAAVHQFVRLGDYCLLGGGSMVSKDVPPFCLAQGDRAHLVGLNTVGLERHSISVESIASLKQLYRQLFMGSGLAGLQFEDRVSRLQSEYQNQQGQAAELGRALLEFAATSERGLTLPRSAGARRE